MQLIKKFQYISLIVFMTGFVLFSSPVYARDLFKEYQSIPTQGACGWESFTIGSDTFLAVANYWNGSTCDIDSKIYFAAFWSSAYDVMFDTQSDLTLLREYRDQFLTKSIKGKLYTTLLYQSSEEALKVLLKHPALMRRANKLIRANKGAVENVLNGTEGVIRNPDTVISFLKAYGKKSPPALSFLTKEVIREMRKQQRRGRPFLGLMLE